MRLAIDAELQPYELRDWLRQRSNGVRSCPMEGVVFVLHGERYPLSSGEKATLDSFMNVSGLAVMRVRGKLRKADDGAEIEITDDAERFVLAESLEAASGDEPHFTEGLQRLLEAARVPITRPPGLG